MENVYNQTMFILKKYNITANKNLGQNFLINDKIIDTIIDCSKISKDTLVIEIGPGLGTLTNRLLEKAGKVIAIELDKKMITILNDRFKLYDNFELINDDILKVNLNSIISNNNFKEVQIVANLPYYITTPIIMKLLEDKINIKSLTVMVQKEVADRLCSLPGDKLSGAITYSINYYSIAKKIIDVPKDCFIPEPEVTSQVIKITLRNEPPVKLDNEELFFKIIKLSFMQRRKTLLNGLSNSGLISKQNALNLIKSIGLNENVRGESLSLEDFANLTNAFDKLIK